MFLKIKNKISKNNFILNVLILAGGTVGGQLIVLLASPLITRLYTPSDFGMLAVYLSIINILTVVTSFRYEFSIPLPRRESHALHAFYLSIIILLIFNVILTIFLYLFGKEILTFVGYNLLSNYIYLIPLSLLFLGIFRSISQLLARKTEFKTISKVKFFQVLVTTIIQILGYKLGLAALLISNTIGYSVGIFGTRNKLNNKINISKIKYKKIIIIARKYHKFPLYDVWYGLFFSIGQRLPPLLFASQFGLHIAGFYALSHRVLASPMSIIGKSVSSVFYVDAAKKNKNGGLSKYFEETYILLVSISMLPLLCLYFYGKPLFIIIFGIEWKLAGEIASVMSVWMFFQFVISPMSGLFSILGQQKIGLLFQVGSLLLRSISLIFGYYYFEKIYVSIILFTFSSVFIYILTFVWLAYKVKSDIKKLIIYMIRELSLNLVVLLPFYIIYTYNKDFLIASLISSAIFFIFLKRNEIRKIIKRDKVN